MMVAKMSVIQWICGHTRFDRARNGMIRSNFVVGPTNDKMREAKLRWFTH